MKSEVFKHLSYVTYLSDKYPQATLPVKIPAIVIDWAKSFIQACLQTKFHFVLMVSENTDLKC